MIELTSLPHFPVVHIVGTGPSADRGVNAEPGELVIAINDAAYGSEGAVDSLIHFTMDLPYARTKRGAEGALGVRMCSGGERRKTTWPTWIPNLDGAKWGGEAAVQLALMAEPRTLHLWGCDGGGKYDQAREAQLAALAGTDVKVVDHS